MSANCEGDSLCFFINGKKVVERNVDPETTLLAFLRQRMQLTGTKSGCGGGGCGACTVMVSNYRPANKTITHFAANSCLLPLCQLQGAAVTTVEGIGSTKTRIHPVQERIARAHGSQCGFCTPGMVMSIYALLRNKPLPSMDDILQALAGNLCRCTGYRPILDGFRTFCQESNCCQVNGSRRHLNGDAADTNESECCQSNGNGFNGELDHGKESECCQGNGNGSFNGELDHNKENPRLFDSEDFLPLDPTQELIFPPELIRLAEEQQPQTLWFRGERSSWVSPVSLTELLHLKTLHPQAPLVMGNTNIGPDMKFKGVVHPLLISACRVTDLYHWSETTNGVRVGAGCSLAEVQALLEQLVIRFPGEQTQVFRALLVQMRNLGSQQIRNVATLGGNIASAFPNSDLNPILAAANCSLTAVCSAGRREVPINQDFFVGFGRTVLKPEEVVVSVFIPFSRKGEVVRAFRQAPRKESSFSTVTSGMRVVLAEGSRRVEEVSLFYGGMAATTVSASRTCSELTGRLWDEETLGRAYDVLLEELSLPPSAPGGKVQFRHCLTLSLLFKFYLDVLQELRDQGGVPAEPEEEMRPLPRDIQTGRQTFQRVSEDQSDEDPVGRPMMHRSAVSQATGEAVYCDDLPLCQGELFLVLVTSSRPHANIIGVDVSEAKQLPGVVDVITADDIPGLKVRSFMGYDEELLAQTQVSCVGQMVCAVVADTKAHAKRGAAAVKISYQDLPDPIFTIEEAIEQSSFFEPRRVIERGNVSEAFQHVDHLHEGSIKLGGQEHFYLETQSMLVVPVGEERELNVYISSQWPTAIQEAVAETLAIPSNRVNCHVKRLGGAFGGKITKTAILASITAVAAWKTNQPVRCVLERGEDMLITGGRHPVTANYKVGFMNDGRILAADVQFYSNAGNALDESVAVMEKILLHMDNAYFIPNLRGRGAACRTNLPSNTSFRGFGVPQTLLVMENLLEDVATLLGRPADQVREVNMYRGPSTTHYQFAFDPENLHRCWDQCKLQSDYDGRRRAVDAFNQTHRWRKRGLALIPIKYGLAFAEGFLNQGAALVHIYNDGSVLVSHGGTEMGQGIHTKIQQVASRELHIPPSKIFISETSTGSVPNTCPSAASFGTDANGMAVKIACEKLYQRLEPIRKKNPKGSWESWTNDAFYEKVSLSATGHFRGPDLYMDWEKMEGQPYSYYVYGVCCSEVELDTLTGDYRTLRTDIVVDIGRSINPSVDIGQIEGAFMQGVGLYTLEELSFSSSGLLLTRGPSQYKIPAVCDVPLQFNTSLLPDSSNAHAIYSSKGIGEPVLSLGSSIFFAIKDAVSASRRQAGLEGVFRLDSPANPERACLACSSPFTQKVPSVAAGSFTPWRLNI